MPDERWTLRFDFTVSPDVEQSAGEKATSAARAAFALLADAYDIWPDAVEVRRHNAETGATS